MANNGNISPGGQDIDQKHIMELLQGIINVQDRHTAMLKQVLDAATKPLDEKSPVATALEALVSPANAQTYALKALTETMQDLPGKIGTTMKAEIDRALNAV